MMTVRTSRWALIRPYGGPALLLLHRTSSCRMLGFRLSYYQSALVALPLKLLLAPHCLQDRVRAPRWSCMSKPWTLGSPGLESGQSGMFPPPCREGPASSPMSQDCSELGIHRWGLLSTGGEREAFSQGPQPSVNSPFFLGAPSNSTSGCLPGPLCLGHPG